MAAGPVFLAVLGFYYLCTLAYSLALKRVTVIDICMLAGLYTLRVIASAAATGNAPSVRLLGSLASNMNFAVKSSVTIVLASWRGAAVSGRGPAAAEAEDCRTHL